MRNLRWTAAAGLVILIGLSLGLFFASGLVRGLRAQSAPTEDLPPPVQDLPAPSAAELPPENGPVPAQQEQLSVEGLPALPPPPTDEPAAQAQPILDASQDPGLRPLNPEGFVYDPSGRRDPFVPPPDFLPLAPSSQSSSAVERPMTPQAPAQGRGEPGELMVNPDSLLAYYVRDLKLIGILWDVSNPRAMVRGPNNMVYTLRLKMKVGREKAVVAAIREREVVLVQPSANGDYKGGEALSLRMNN